MLMQNLGGQTKSIMVFSELAYCTKLSADFFFPESCDEEDVLASVQQKGEDYSVLLQQSGTFTPLFLVCVVEVTWKLFSQAPISRPTS